MNIQETFDLIRQWADARNIIGGSTPRRQIDKLAEEFQELVNAVDQGDHGGIVDGIGDMIVVLTILAEQHGEMIEACIETAYFEIKDRKGKMIDGLFVKEAA